MILSATNQLSTDGPFRPIRPVSVDRGKQRAAARSGDWETLDDEALTPEEVSENARIEQFMRIENFGAAIMSRRDEAIKSRAGTGVESRWIADTEAYLGRDGAAREDENWDVLLQGQQSTRQGPEKKPRRRSRVFVQVTRQKTNVGAARVQDLLVPSDERNWQMRQTPVPQLAKLLEHHGDTRVRDQREGPTQGQEMPHPTEERPLTVADLVGEALSQARTKCDNMQREIDDQHVECQYNDQCRVAIEDAAKLGTGILKGPVVVNRIKKVWANQGGQWTMQVEEDLRPASFRVDPWNFYPAPGCGHDFQKGGFCFEREPVSRATLKSLARVKSYDSAAIELCLQEGPAADPIFLSRRNQGYVDSGAFERTNFDLWNYCGDVDGEELEALGVNIPKNLMANRITAQVVMCNSRVIKAILNPMDTGDLPYDMFQWDTLDDGPWGVGIPYIMRYAQRSLNAAWRQMQDNAGVSHGPQIVMNRSVIEPADKDWNITGMKLWHTKGGANVEDVNKAFTVFQIDSNQVQLQAIIELCLKFIDDETAIPMMAQGEKGSAPDKVGIVSMLMNAANVVLKRIARNWDMRVTNPHLRRYYDWNMQYSEKDEIKGDFEVHALGSTALVVRDQQKQDIANLMAMSADPAYKEFVNPKKVMEVAWKMSSVPDVLYTAAELQENAAAKAQEKPQEESQITVARIRAEAAVEAQKVEGESERVNQELRMEEAKRNDEREIYKMELQRDLQILEQASKMDMTVAQIKGMLAGKVMDIQANHRVAETKAATEAMKIGQFKTPKRKPIVRPPKSAAQAQLLGDQ